MILSIAFMVACLAAAFFIWQPLRSDHVKRKARIAAARDNETRLTLEYLRSLRDDESGAA